MLPPLGPQQAAPQAPAQAFGWAATSANPTSAPAFGWASAPPASAKAQAYSGATDPDAFLGSIPRTEILDPARSARLLEDAQRALAFATWWSGPLSRRAQVGGGADRTDRVAAADAWPNRDATALSPDAPGAFAGNATAPVVAMGATAPPAPASAPAPADARVPPDWVDPLNAPLGADAEAEAAPTLIADNDRAPAPHSSLDGRNDSVPVTPVGYRAGAVRPP
jgi:hypothetical protein